MERRKITKLLGGTQEFLSVNDMRGNVNHYNLFIIIGY